MSSEKIPPPGEAISSGIGSSKSKVSALAGFPIFIRGLAMGTADAVPGVSGGTIALITGIYEKLLSAISSVDFSLLLKRKLKDFLRSIDFGFFLPLGTGIILALFAFSRLLQYLLLQYPAETYSFFIGLIAASALVLLKALYRGREAEQKSMRQAGGWRFLGLFGLLGLVAAYFIAGLPAVAANHSLPVVFFSGLAAICAMILPGISGAFVLVLLNQYQYLIGSLHSYQWQVVGTFALGALIGFFSFARLVQALLRRFHQPTIAVLIGLMLGSLRAPLRQVYGSLSPTAISLAFLGALVVFSLEIMGRKQNK